MHRAMLNMKHEKCCCKILLLELILQSNHLLCILKWLPQSNGICHFDKEKTFYTIMHTTALHVECYEFSNGNQTLAKMLYVCMLACFILQLQAMQLASAPAHYELYATIHIFQPL